MQAKLVLLPGRTRKRERLCELASSFGRIETQEIDRLAHFQHAVDQCLPGFADAEREEFFRMLLVEIGGALEQFRAGFTAQRIPPDLRGMPGVGHPVDLGRRRFEGGPDSDAMVMGRHNRPSLALSNAWLRDPAARFKRFQALEQRLAHQRVAKVDADAVAARCAKEVAWQDDLWVALRVQRFQFRDRVAHQLID